MRAFKSYFTPVAEERGKEGEKTTASLASTPGKDAGRRWRPKQSKQQHGVVQDPSAATIMAQIELSPRSGNSDAAPGLPPNLATPQHDFLHPSSAVSTFATTTATANTPAASVRTSFRRSSVFPNLGAAGSDFSLIDAKNDMRVKWLHEEQLRKNYYMGLSPFEGVVLKKARGDFTCCPPEMASHPVSLYSLVAQMNVRCAMTVNTVFIRSVIQAILRTKPNVGHIPLSKELRVQVIPSMMELPRCQLHQFAAFVEDLSMLVVWEDDSDALLHRIHVLEGQLVEAIWGQNPHDADDKVGMVDRVDEKTADYSESEDEVHEDDAEDLEDGTSREHRPVRLNHALIVALTLAFCISTLGIGWRRLAAEIAYDGSFVRLALLVAAPVQMVVGLFFFQIIISNLFQIFGPITALTSNSKYYSGKPPRRLKGHGEPLPHVTIQLPVYKEGLESVIKPTVLSLKAAISTYELQGGTANIFVNDDGMQIISEEQAQNRRDFYDEHNIGWVARPPHCPKPDVEAGERLFLRRGKFKKASNMNYGLMVSNLVEEKLGNIVRRPGWNKQLESDAYAQCLADVLEESEGRVWAEGNIRIGDYILIVDSDTRVPRDCLLDGVSEMEESPEVALIQFSSGVMNVTTSYFERGVTWFTYLIYTAITYACAMGDVCPFVGHNAMLRWRAIQDVCGYVDEDGYEKYWSESHVSEDFDMALRLQINGYSLRYSGYLKDGFKEGVSLTVYDELARWEKYAFGVTELIFNPFRYWLVRGPFTPLFRRFMFSSIGLAKKFSILAYMGTYFAIAAAWAIVLMNYFVTGWLLGEYDSFYDDSFAIYVSVIVVFSGLGNLALAILRYRTTDRSLLGSLFENFKWVPLFTIFIGGTSLHLARVVLCHLLEIPVSWGATSKEVTRVHFGTEILKVLKNFKGTFLYCFACTGLMVAGVYALPDFWQIHHFFSIYPLGAFVVAHFALPVCLNPALMMYSW